MKNNYLVQAWLVLSLSVVFSAGLAGVQIALADKIDANKFAETMEQIPSLVEGATGGEKVDIEGRIVYRAVNADGNPVGWVVPASGQGFADVIEVLIGLDLKAETITGIYVLAQKETPGLGNKIVEPLFQDAFIDKDTDTPLSITKASPTQDSEIPAITGATISSQSVTKIVNDTVAELRDKLAAMAK